MGRVVSMDEVGFGPRREVRLPSRRLRAFIAAGSVALAAVAGVAVAVTAAGARHATSSPPPALQSGPAPASLIPQLTPGCPPAQKAWPDLAGLPAGLRVGALPLVVSAQFSGEC
jgi:hypothetical protein